MTIETDLEILTASVQGLMETAKAESARAHHLANRCQILQFSLSETTEALGSAMPFLGESDIETNQGILARAREALQ